MPCEDDIRSVCLDKIQKSQKANPRPKSAKGLKNFEKKAKSEALRQEKLTNVFKPVVSPNYYKAL